MTAAGLRLDGTSPDSRDMLMIVIIVWLRTGRHDLTSEVGMGSNLQVDDLALDTRLVTWSMSSELKEERLCCGGQAAGMEMSCTSWWAPGG